MKYFLSCTEKFFDVANDYFKFALVAASIQRTEGLYKLPNIYVSINTETLPAPEICNAWTEYCQGLFIHELCHVFRNYINKAYDLIHAVDHGLTFKSYVSLDDLKTELEVLTLEEYILRKTDSRFFKNGELYHSIRQLNSRVPEVAYSEEFLANEIKSNEKRWNTIGIDGLQEQFQGMIDELKMPPS